ncbi:MAG: alkaline phosphatase [Acidobacteria bacterium]|nr:alkaline phosphatase [Acidobacteriota bacterium]
MRTFIILAGLIYTIPCEAEKLPSKAKNVILFLADAGGLGAVNAASIHGYDKAQSLFVQSWPNIGLSDTSTASQWVSDSAAGMSAIMTGQKTHNGVISMGPDTARGKQDGARLKTLLMYAEEHGLSTGVMTNVNVADATPAACYSNANDRRKYGEIIQQAFAPKYGDGPDVLMGIGRAAIDKSLAEQGSSLDALSQKHGRKVYASLSDVPSSEPRPVVIQEKDMNLPAAAEQALERLSRNKKGYFLMIEWDAHTDNPQQGLGNLVAFDKLIRSIAGKVNMKETLLIFTADHSFDISTKGGKRGEPLLAGYEEWKQKNAAQRNAVVEIPALRVNHNHTGEEVVVAAMGPGADKVHGFLPNTRIFEVMLEAYGWKR